MIKIKDELGNLITVVNNLEDAKSYTERYGGFYGVINE